MNSIDTAAEPSAALDHQVQDINRSADAELHLRRIMPTSQHAEDESWRMLIQDRGIEQPRTADCALYRPRHAPLPADLTCLQLCQLFPNHIYGQHLDDLLKHGYTATIIWKALPDEYKEFLKEKKDAKNGNWNNGYHTREKVDGESDINERNLYYKRIQRRNKILNAQGVFDKVVQDPNARPDGRSGRGQSSATEGDQVYGTAVAQNADIALTGTLPQSAMLDTINADHLSRLTYDQLTLTPNQPGRQTSTQPFATQRPQQLSPIAISNPARFIQHPVMLPQPQIPSAIGAIFCYTTVELPVYEAPNGHVVRIVPSIFPHGHISNVSAIADHDVRGWCSKRDAGILESRSIFMQPDGNIHEVFMTGEVIGHPDDVDNHLAQNGLAAPASETLRRTLYMFLVQFPVVRAPTGDIVRLGACTKIHGDIDNITGIQDETVRRCYTDRCFGNNAAMPVCTLADGTIVEIVTANEIVGRADDLTTILNPVVRRAMGI